MNVVAAIEHLSYLARFCAEEARDTRYLPEERDRQMQTLMDRLLLVALEMETISATVAALFVEAGDKH